MEWLCLIPEKFDLGSMGSTVIVCLIYKRHSQTRNHPKETNSLTWEHISSLASEKQDSPYNSKVLNPKHKGQVQSNFI